MFALFLYDTFIFAAPKASQLAILGLVEENRQKILLRGF